VLINKAVNNLVDVVVVGAKAIPQGVVLPLVTPQEIVKTNNPEGLHIKRQLTPPGKVSLFALLVKHAATKIVPAVVGNEYA